MKRLAVASVVAILVEIVLAHVLAGRDVVGRLLASGAGASHALVAVALVYLVVRLIVFVVLPGALAARAAASLVDRIRRSRRMSPS